MFDQIIGDGANLFFIIVAVIIGFVAAMSYQDFVKVKNEEKKDHRDIH